MGGFTPEGNGTTHHPVYALFLWRLWFQVVCVLVVPPPPPGYFLWGQGGTNLWKFFQFLGTASAARNSQTLSHGQCEIIMGSLGAGRSVPVLGGRMWPEQVPQAAGGVGPTH